MYYLKVDFYSSDEQLITEHNSFSDAMNYMAYGKALMAKAGQSFERLPQIKGEILHGSYYMDMYQDISFEIRPITHEEMNNAL